MQPIESSFYIPHCSVCCQDFSSAVLPYKAACSHLFCAPCRVSHTSKTFVCPIDAKESEYLSDCPELNVLIEKVLSEDRTDLAEVVEVIFDDINVQSVPCKYVYDSLNCPNRVNCRYHHGLCVRKDRLKCSSGLLCSVCDIKVTKEKVYCPFCMKAVKKHVQSDQPMSDSVLGNEEMFKSMEPSFPEPSHPPNPSCPEDYIVIEAVEEDAEEVDIQISRFKYLLLFLRWLNDRTVALFSAVFKSKEPPTLTFLTK